MSKKIVFKSSDGKSFEVDETVALESGLIKHRIEEECAGNEIDVPNITSNILEKVIEYCKKHVEAAAVAKSDDDKDNELKVWDKEFVKVDDTTLRELIMASSYLRIHGLIELTCKAVVDSINFPTHSNINNTPEQDDKSLKENQWPSDFNF